MPNLLRSWHLVALVALASPPIAGQPAGASESAIVASGRAASDAGAEAAPAQRRRSRIDAGRADRPTPGRPPEKAGVRCGPKTCAAGEVCCNESCGICTPKGAVCTQQICEPPRPSDGGVGVGVGQACRADADCRLFSDLCTGCDCRALARGETDPTCTGPGVRCVANPCQEKTARCDRGRCVVAVAPKSR